MPADELTCAFPARKLAEVVAQLERSMAADAAVSAYADADIRENFTAACCPIKPVTAGEATYREATQPANL
jgi:hypothetical protein